MGASRLVLNVAPVSLSVDMLCLGCLDYTGEDDYRVLREEYWQTHAFRFDSRSGAILNVPLESGLKPVGTVETVRLADHLLLAAKAVQHRLLLALAGKFPILKGTSKRLIFLGQVDQSRLLSRALEKHGLSSIDGVEVFLRYELDCRMFFHPNGEPYLGLVVDVGTTNVIDVPASDLLDRGVSIVDRYVTQRGESEHGEVRPGLEAVGRVIAVAGDWLMLTDARGEEKVRAADVLLEPRIENLHLVIEAFSGSKSDRVLAALKELRGPVTSSMGKLTEIERTLGILRRQKFSIGEGIEIELGELVREGDEAFPDQIATERPNLLFGAHGTNTDTIPDRGINSWGPYKYLQHERNSPVLGVICEARHRGRVEQFMNMLCNGIEPRHWKGNGRNPYPKGLISGFRLSKPRIEIEDVPEGNAQRYREAATKLLARLPRAPDLVFIQVSEGAKSLPGQSDPYLVCKAIFMASGVISQAVRIETIDLPDDSLAYALPGLACASYAKLDGTPWVVSTRAATTHELVLGIGMAEAREERLGDAERYIGITTVFQGDGRYLVWGLTREVAYSDYPEALLQSLRTAVRYVREQDDWEPGDKVRLVFHVYKSLKKQEIDATKVLVRELLQDSFEVEFAFLDVSWYHSYLLFDRAQQGKSYRSGGRWKTRGKGVPERGTCLQLDARRALLHLTGPTEVKLEDQGLPRPLLIELHSDSDFTDITYLARQVYHFTFASWQSTLPASEPVTIKYSRMIARLLGNMRRVPEWSSTSVTTGLLRGRTWFL